MQTLTDDIAAKSEAIRLKDISLPMAVNLPSGILSRKATECRGISSQFEKLNTVRMNAEHKLASYLPVYAQHRFDMTLVQKPV